LVGALATKCGTQAPGTLNPPLCVCLCGKNAEIIDLDFILGDDENTNDDIAIFSGYSDLSVIHVTFTIKGMMIVNDI
jgi:hypothetical protein